MSSVEVVVFTRDLRVRDHPALLAANRADATLPLFVLDPATLVAHRSATRTAFLLESLADLRAQLAERGGDLVVRHGDWVREVAEVVRSTSAQRVHLSEDVSAHAARRTERLRDELGDEAEVVLHPGVTVVPAGSTAPSGGGEWKVFTPYHRSWEAAPWRDLHRPPRAITLPDGVEPGRIPELSDLVDGDPAPDRVRGGETRAVEHLRSWAASSLEDYDDLHDDVAADATSRISPYLHMGCLSPLEVATRLRGRPGAAAFVRQLCWRDFYHQVLAARPDASHEDYRHRGDHWREAPEELAAWKEGRTGFPLVDAGMRQLVREGFVHNRARMVVASFLTKDLHLDWRHGAAHFMRHLVDGDVASNQLNWQWTAGTGTDTNPHRIFNPTTQSRRFDPDGTYIRRYVEELADVEAPGIHEPDAATRERTGYPAPLVDHHEAIDAYRAAVAAADRG